MKFPLVLCLFCLMCFLRNVHAQNNDFSVYREQLLNRFHEHQKNIYDNYAQYLDGVWKRYEAFKGVKRNKAPKPIVVPTVETTPTSPIPMDVPNPIIVPSTPVMPQPQTPPTPVLPVTGDYIHFDFYGMIWKAPKINYLKLSIIESQSIAKVWEEYRNSSVAKVIPTLKTIAATNGLNDWFTFQMVRLYIDAVAKDGSHAERIILQHYILVNLGFDIRMAIAEKQMLLLVPFKQQVYERSYITIDNSKYYVFCDNIDSINEFDHLYTCTLPKDAYCGEFLNLTYNCQNRIEQKEIKTRKLTDGFIEVVGNINTVLMEMLRHYPQMDVADYARSSIDMELRNSILSQLRPQIQGLPQEEAANKLIHFVQYAFEYATDGEQHQYEKAYFFEENFYYSKNDCEDRAIFYAYLVKHLLGLDVHLIQYPGHECTAVNFEDSNISGDGYIYEGKRFLICDPTYIGAKIGMCMPNYKNTAPIIELWY